MSESQRPVSVPFLDLGSMHREVDAEVQKSFADAIQAGAFVGGAAVEAFERQFAEYCDSPHCVGVANGTDALVLILRGLGVGPGDEVIVPTNTFIATAAAVALVGATPVFVDVEPGRLLMTADSVAAHVSPRTAAMIVVHLYGQVAEMNALVALAERHGVALIEDVAQAHGASFGGQKVGSFGAAAAFSFYPGKNLGAFGDGGAVVTSDAALAESIRSLSNHGRAGADRYLHERVGVNSRLDALQALVLSTKLARLDEWNAERRRVHQHYVSALAGSAVTCLAPDERTVDVWHLEVVRVGNRQQVQQSLDEGGIGHGVHYPVPCHRQPAFADIASYDLPIASQVAHEILSLPMFPHLDAARIERVCEVLKSVASPATVFTSRNSAP